MKQGYQEIKQPPIPRRSIELLDKALEGKSNAAVCVAAGYGKDTVSRWRNGRKNPSAFALEDILQAAGYELAIRKITK